MFGRYPNSKVIITCRSHEITTLNKFVSYSGSVPQVGERTILHIRPFTRDKTKGYVKKVTNNPEETWKRIDSVPNLEQLLDTPLMLRIVFGDPTMIQELPKEGATRFTIYRLFMESLHKKNIQKLEQRGKITKLKAYSKLCIKYALNLPEDKKLKPDESEDCLLYTSDAADE